MQLLVSKFAVVAKVPSPFVRGVRWWLPSPPLQPRAIWLPLVPGGPPPWFFAGMLRCRGRNQVLQAVDFRPGTPAGIVTVATGELPLHGEDVAF